MARLQFEMGQTLRPRAALTRSFIALDQAVLMVAQAVTPHPPHPPPPVPAIRRRCLDLSPPSCVFPPWVGAACGLLMWAHI